MLRGARALLSKPTTSPATLSLEEVQVQLRSLCVGHEAEDEAASSMYQTFMTCCAQILHTWTMVSMAWTDSKPRTQSSRR